MAPKKNKEAEKCRFEIPAKKISRAKKFYESILDVEMLDMDLGTEFNMTMFPVE